MWSLHSPDGILSRTEPWESSECMIVLTSPRCCDTTQLKSRPCQESRPEVQQAPSFLSSPLQKPPATPFLRDFSTLSTSPSLPSHWSHQPSWALMSSHTSLSPPPSTSDLLLFPTPAPQFSPPSRFPCLDQLRQRCKGE